MSSPVDSSGLDRLLGQTMQALDQLRGAPADGAVSVGSADGAVSVGSADGDGEESEPIEGVGEAADGLIRAVAAAGGQLAGLYLDPAVLQMGAAALAEEIVAAVNAAAVDLQEQMAGAFGAPDLDALAGQLKEIGEESNRQMSSFLDALTEAQQRIANQARQA
jgi:hypothetical protein